MKMFNETKQLHSYLYQFKLI